MARLPQPGGDDGNWGDILNDFLIQAHSSNGTLKDDAVSAAKLAASGGSDGQVLSKNSALPGGLQWVASSGGASDATTLAKGIVQLAGDLGGTAASPTVPGLAGKESVITAGTTLQYWRGDKSWQTLDKAAIGLANADNTSDANKPISAATQTVLNNKTDRSTLTTKGDIYAATAASTPARLAVGTDDQVLTVDSSQATGLKWASSGKIFILATDYGVTFDGSTDDATAMQNAINAAISSKKILYLAPGTAIIGTQLIINAALTVMGAGRESTILKAKNNLNNYMMLFSAGVGVAINGAHFMDFTVDGNFTGQTAGGGIQADGAVQCTFERIHFTACYDFGLKLGPMNGGAFGHHNRVVSCLFDNSSSPGVGGGAWLTSSDENWFVASDFEFLGGATQLGGKPTGMIYDNAGLQHIVGCNFVAGYNNVIGVRVRDTKGTKVTSSTFDGIPGDGVFIVGNKCVVSDNIFTGIGDNGSTVPASGIHTEYAAHFNVISGNMLETSTNTGNTRSLIREENIGNPGDNLIVGNSLSQNAAPTDALLETGGTNTIIRDNIGWVTESSGTATVANGTTSIAVTHNQSGTPGIQDISATPTNSLGNATKFWITNITATQFTINVDVDPGATTATLAWNVRRTV